LSFNFIVESETPTRKPWLVAGLNTHHQTQNYFLIYGDDIIWHRKPSRPSRDANC